MSFTLNRPRTAPSEPDFFWGVEVTDAFIVEPSEKITLVDSAVLQIFSECYTFRSGAKNGVDYKIENRWVSSYWGPLKGSVHPRHLNGFNITFVDSHVKFFRQTRRRNWDSTGAVGRTFPDAP